MCASQTSATDSRPLRGVSTTPAQIRENVLLDDVRDEFLSTALHWAALKGHGAIATLLIDHHQTANIQYVAFSLACDAGEASTC